MLYKFKSQATGDVIMLTEPAAQFFRVLGREAAAAGIIEVAAMPAALAALEAAVAAPPDGQTNVRTNVQANDPDDTPAADTAVALRQRLWPMIEMLRRAHAAGQAVVWGV